MLDFFACLIEKQILSLTFWKWNLREIMEKIYMDQDTDLLQQLTIKSYSLKF
jgi:hypothetical protein